MPAELFPVRVVYKKEEYAERRFFFCNVFDLLDCFDYENGEYEYEESGSGRVRGVVKLAIHEDEAEGHDLFRIANGGTTILCVSDRVAAASRS